jgi:hypothetical protein
MTITTKKMKSQTLRGLTCKKRCEYGDWPRISFVATKGMIVAPVHQVYQIKIKTDDKTNANAKGKDNAKNNAKNNAKTKANNKTKNIKIKT